MPYIGYIVPLNSEKHNYCKLLYYYFMKLTNKRGSYELNYEDGDVVHSLGKSEVVQSSGASVNGGDGDGVHRLGKGKAVQGSGVSVNGEHGDGVHR